MSFNPQSLQRLRELGRKLPEKLPPTKASHSKEPQAPKKAHPIETTEDPQTLFHELIKASPGGEIPSHLIARLKELESRQDNNNKRQRNDAYESLKDSTKKRAKEDSLYNYFDRLLLEEDGEI